MKTEIADYQQAKIDALEFVASLGITAEIKLNGVAETPAGSKEDKPWLHFRWLCHCTKDLGDRGLNHADFDGYKTGIGNAIFKEHNWRHGPAPCGGSVQLEQFARTGQIHRFTDSQTRLAACRYLKPKAPDLADILGSYARDYVDAHHAGSFEEWAAGYGANPDSIREQANYHACLAQRKPLLALGLSMAEIEKIAEYTSQF